MAERTAAGQGTIVLHGSLPRGATVRVDGERKTSERFKVAAGAHQIQIDAQGFQPFNQSVTVATNGTASVDVVMQPARGGTTSTASNVDCASPTYFQSNSNHACFDEGQRPHPLTTPAASPPSSCSGASRIRGAATILVHISAAGEVVDQPVVMHSSGCRDFDNLAVQQIQDIQFAPAKKNGQAVIGWVQVPMQAR